jgi:uncharacterized membrane protein YeaQ/YmgE (transglycosylase-associated protein family)
MDRTRANLAFSLVALLVLIVCLILVATFARWVTASDAKDLLGVLLSPVVGLVGAATGFYFGERIADETAKGS